MTAVPDLDPFLLEVVRGMGYQGPFPLQTLIKPQTELGSTEKAIVSCGRMKTSRSILQHPIFCDLLKYKVVIYFSLTLGASQSSI